MIDLMSEFPNIEFVFADAPSNNVWMQDPPYGKNYPTTDPDWADDSISYLDSLVTVQVHSLGYWVILKEQPLFLFIYLKHQIILNLH